MSVAVKRELIQVESLIKDLSTTSFKAEQPTVNDRATKVLRNRDLQLELETGPYSHQTRAVAATVRVLATKCAQDGLGDHNNNT